MEASTSAPALAEEVSSARWYHTIELPGGIVTPGDYDLPDALRRIPFPESLEGKRCLDVGTRDGFWAFEMEKRGASEVLGIDVFDFAELDWPLPKPDWIAREDVVEAIAQRSQAFEIAKRALGSKVERRNLSVYDLDPAEVGTFDFAFVGTLLIHLRDPVGALAAVARVLDGELLSNDPVALFQSWVFRRSGRARVAMLGGRPYWWVTNVEGRRRVIAAAGFEILESGRPYLMRYGPGWTHPPLELRPPHLIPRQLLLRRGAAHVCVRARTR